MRSSSPTGACLFFVATLLIIVYATPGIAAGGLSSAEVGGWLEWMEFCEYKKATDQAKAAALYSKAQQILLDDAASFFLVDYKYVVVKRAELKGLKMLPLYNGAYFIYRLTRD